MATKKRPYADTRVSVMKSRADTEAVLRKHGVTATQWTTHGDKSCLRFQFEHKGRVHTVRYVIDPRTQGEEYEPWSKRTENEHWEREARILHRVLFHAVKSNLEVLSTGLLDPISVWLPQIEAGVHTVRERVEMNLELLTDPGATLGSLIALPAVTGE